MDRLTLQSSPHLYKGVDTQKIMLDVLLALIPAIVASIIFYSYFAVIVLVTCTLASVFMEWLINKIRKKTNTINDLSAVLTGVLLGLTLPATAGSWEYFYVCIIGSFFAIGIVKMCFGGLGYNIFNPALAGRAFLLAAFPNVMTNWIEPGKFDLTAITSATPLGIQKKILITEGGSLQSILKDANVHFPDMSKLIVGDISGSIGETSVIAILIGGIYLFVRKIICFRIVTSLFLGAFVTSGIFYLVDPTKFLNPLYHLFSGGLMLGAFFMATDLVTSPITKKGRWIFGACIGALLIFIRLFSGLPEGVMYAILIMNACVPLINSYTIPKPLGYYKSEKKQTSVQKA